MWSRPARGTAVSRCPLCGGNVVKTCKGYRCEHNIGDNPSCILNINAIIGNRKMADAEVAELLEKRRILLDGFASKEEKAFPTVLELADDGNILMQPVIGRCPHCGGEIRVGSRAFNCSNWKPWKYARRASLLRNWRCTGKTAASTVSGSAYRLTNFKS